MSYTIVSDVCQGSADCFPVCPVECIHWAEGKVNKKNMKYAYIDDQTCINCGACLSACPVEGAIHDQWEPELQTVKHSDYSQPAPANDPSPEAHP